MNTKQSLSDREVDTTVATKAKKAIVIIAAIFSAFTSILVAILAIASIFFIQYNSHDWWKIVFILTVIIFAILFMTTSFISISVLFNFKHSKILKIILAICSAVIILILTALIIIFELGYFGCVKKEANIVIYIHFIPISITLFTYIRQTLWPAEPKAK